MNQRKQALLVGAVATAMQAGMSTTSILRGLARSGSYEESQEQARARIAAEQEQKRLLTVPVEVQAKIDRKEAKRKAKKEAKRKK